MSPVPGGAVPECSQGGIPTAVPSGEAEVGEETGSGPEESGRSPEPFSGSPAAAPAGPRVRVSPQD